MALEVGECVLRGRRVRNRRDPEFEQKPLRLGVAGAGEVGSIALEHGVEDVVVRIHEARHQSSSLEIDDNRVWTDEGHHMLAIADSDDRVACQR